MPTGTKINIKQKKQITKMGEQGFNGYEIAELMELGSSTVYRVLNKSKKRTDFSIGATKKDYDIISNFATTRGISKRNALTILLRNKVKKHWWNWR
jgi:DNA invertase Pin-like site-specific DNA recombinase